MFSPGSQHENLPTVRMYEDCAVGFEWGQERHGVVSYKLLTPDPCPGVSGQSLWNVRFV